MSRLALIVDDSATARHMLARMLRGLDFECHFSQSGQEALDQLAYELPDIIFLDHLMPGLDGFQTLGAIKQNPRTRHIPVVMYTSQNALKYQEEAMALGAAGVITKQVDKEALYILVEKVCLAQDIGLQVNAAAPDGTAAGSANEIQPVEPSPAADNVVPFQPKHPSPGGADKASSPRDSETFRLRQRLNLLESRVAFLRLLVFLLLLISVLLGIEVLQQHERQVRLTSQMEGHRKALQELIDLVDPASKPTRSE
ncbi:response regulator [Hahella sp. SMD15-11]|uniref:Response regulator n=1 Tax=Thermohahella caldifontis TaxID=3142973 RepID=A0AB39UYL6_9GAMM